MGLKVTNNAYGTLNAGINSSATTIVLNGGEGSRFPTLSAGDYFYATLIDTSNNLEIVKVTARSTDTMTVVRGQDNTTARAYSTNDRFELRPTAALFNEIISKATATGVSDQANSSTGYFALPSGTTAERPVSPTGNMIRKNTTTGYIEYYDTATSTWIGIGAFVASGGTTTTSGNYTYHTFTTSGSFVVSSGSKAIEYLVVAGGGAGGSSNSNSSCGGGGAGGYVAGSATATPGIYTVTIGAGGAGNFDLYGNSGNNTVFGALATAVGGGGGGGGAYQTSESNGRSGGSGGGSLLSGTPGSGTSGQGNAGGQGSVSSPNWGGGGGGGASAAGSNGTSTLGGAGGAGSNWQSLGTYYAGGGGGACESGASGTQGAGGIGGGGAGAYGTARDGTAGTANTGGGGGGTTYGGSGSCIGASGGSGIVIIRYLT